MPSTDLLLAFLAAAAVFAYMPGPAMIYAAAQTLARGRRAGFMAAVGIHLGGYVHVAAAAFGLSAVFTLVPVAYWSVKLAGAAYLIWLGFTIIIRRDERALASGTIKSPGRAFAESIVVEVLNPKTAVFFIAFLPQFADPDATLPLWGQLLVLGTVVNGMFSSADIVCVLFAGAVVDRLRRSGRAQRIIRLLGGGILLGLGGKLALDN